VLSAELGADTEGRGSKTKRCQEPFSSIDIACEVGGVKREACGEVEAQVEAWRKVQVEVTAIQHLPEVLLLGRCIILHGGERAGPIQMVPVTSIPHAPACLSRQEADG